MKRGGFKNGPQHQRQGKPVNCEVCGKAFYARPSEMRRGRRFCSRDCWRIGGDHRPSLRPEVRDKIAAAKTTHGRSAGRRQRQLEHAGCTLAAKGESRCRNCGSEKYLQLHHAIPRSMWKAGILEPLNCVPLCTGCHMTWHNRWRDGTLPRSIFTEAEWACISSASLLGQDITAWLDRRYPPVT